MRVEPATSRDAPGILALRREIEDWLESKGVEQWGRGEIGLSDVQRQVAADEWHVMRAGGQLLGGLRLLWSDEQVWRQQHTPSAYVHGLMVTRAPVARGLGVRLLTWAERRARAAAVPALRLDCVESNAVLRAYYQRLGFTEVGRRDFDGPWFSAVLFEKVLSGGS